MFIILNSYKLLPRNHAIIIYARSYMCRYKALLVNTFCIPIFLLFAINFINIQTILHVLISQSRHHLYLEETTNAKLGFARSSLNIYNCMPTFHNFEPSHKDKCLLWFWAHYWMFQIDKNKKKNQQKKS